MSESNSGNKAKVIQLDEYDRALGTDELNLAEWPTSLLATRNDTGQNTLLFEDSIFDEGANKQVQRTVLIVGSDHFGLPTSTDSDILLLLLHLTNVRNGLKEKRVEFTRYELVKFLGWSLDGRSYRRLDEALHRWTSVTLHFKHSWWDRSQLNWKSRTFHVLDNFEIRGREDMRDEGTSSFTWNDVIFQSFQAGNLKRINLGVYFNLTLAISRQIYRFLDKRFYNKGRLEFDLRQFATEHVGLSRRYDNHDLKRKLLPALRELEEIGFIATCSEKDRFQRKSWREWTITVQKGSGVAAQQDSKLVNELTSRGVNRKVARELVSQFTEDQIESKIQMHDALVSVGDKRINKNAAGFLASSIRYDYKEPPPAKPARSTRLARVEAAPEISPEDEAEAQQKRVKDEEFKRYWNAQPLEDQIRIEREAISGASRFHRETLKRLEKSNNGLLSEMRLKLVRDEWEKKKRR